MVNYCNRDARENFGKRRRLGETVYLFMVKQEAKFTLWKLGRKRLGSSLNRAIKPFFNGLAI